ncbi:DMT family transporter [Oligella urethralis]|nr:DMT family transporter [Oligella urethralis]MDK6203460.1 DMT family transporter [Oligella urethralis]
MVKQSSTEYRPFGKAELALMLITVFWGGTFLIVQIALSMSEPFFFVGLRFACAAAAVALCSPKVLRGLSFEELKAGIAIGVCIFLGYSLQTLGLQTIPSSKSAFLTALYVPLVPLLQWLFLKRRPTRLNALGIMLAFMGLACLAGPDGLEGTLLGRGELFTILGALAIAAEIILISCYAGKINLIRVTVLQLLVTSIIAFTVSAGVGEQVPDFSWGLIAIVLLMGFASALIQTTMNWAQKHVSATRATLIYAAEPVWGGVFGRLYGERLPFLSIIGAGLIVLGVIVSELRLNGLKRKTKRGGRGLR